NLQFGDHLHYGSFGDLIVRGSYVKSEGSVKAEILNKMDVAGRMKHENVVRMDGFAIEEMTCYMVLEPMEASLSEVSRLSFKFWII
ncbi:hypothetical protein PENTCL1PPCAC_18833, partial [Pristionchus entomophagus]